MLNSLYNLVDESPNRSFIYKLVIVYTVNNIVALLTHELLQIILKVLIYCHQVVLVIEWNIVHLTKIVGIIQMDIMDVLFKLVFQLFLSFDLDLLNIVQLLIGFLVNLYIAKDSNVLGLGFEWNVLLLEVLEVNKIGKQLFVITLNNIFDLFAIHR